MNANCELRAVAWLRSGEDKKTESKNLTYGVGLKVDLKELIDSIYVSPSAPGWLHSLVQSVVKKYELDVEVHQSKLNESPIY